MTASTFDRWLYLRLHRWGLMGGTARATLGRIVRPGMTVVDVGGNIGLYTVLLSRLVGPAGRVIAFEPDPLLYAQLRANCDRNGCRNVEAHNLALGSRPERLVLRQMILNSGDNTLSTSAVGTWRRQIEVEVVPLDRFLPDIRPDLVKIDVQGWELEVLRGMEHILNASPRIGLHMEFWPAGLRRAGSTADELVDWLLALGFQLRRASEPDAIPLDRPALTALAQALGKLKFDDLYALCPTTTVSPCPSQPIPR